MDSLATRGVVSGRLVERTQQSLDEVLAHARPAVTTLLRQVRGQDDAPDELEVEFGIQISLEVGAYIAAASSYRELPSDDRWHSHAHDLPRGARAGLRCQHGWRDDVPGTRMRA